MENKNRRRNDVLLIGGLLLLAVLCGGVLLWQKQGQQNAADGTEQIREAVVSLDGNEVLRLRLSEGTGDAADVLEMDAAYVRREEGADGGEAIFSIYKEGSAEEAGGVNRLSVKNGEIACTYADCPDQICVSQGYISAQTETIVCLPHRMIVTILSSVPD